MATSREYDEALEMLGKALLDAAFCVHSALGPGLLESVYEACFEIELRRRGIACERQKLVRLRYQGELVRAEIDWIWLWRIRLS
jgi:GxxExxY protein